MNEKRIRQVVIWAVSLVALVVTAGFAFAMWENLSDGPRPDTSDLVPERVPIPDAANGYVDLKGIDSLVKSDGSSPIIKWLQQKEWDQQKVDSLIDKNQPALDLLDKSLVKPRFQWPEANQNPDYFWPLIELANLKALSAAKHWKQKQQSIAFREVFQSLETARRLESSGIDLEGLLTAKSVQRNPLGLLCRFVAETSAKQRPEMESALLQLEHDVDHAARFCDALRNKEMYFDHVFEGIPSGVRTVSDLQYGMPTFRLQEKLFQRNNTWRMFAETIRQLIHEAPLTYDKTHKAPGTLKSIGGMSQRRRLLSPNGGGRMVYMEVFSGSTSWVSRKCLIITQVGMTRTLIALRLYWWDYGKLPDTLNDLVPAYLDSVPLDAYDGKPLRYSPTDKVVYSVGKDLVDHGGDLSDEDTDEAKQPTVKIGW